jgi:hypothetical protein
MFARNHEGVSRCQRISGRKATASARSATPFDEAAPLAMAQNKQSSMTT